MLEELEDVSKQIGLKMNLNKTKIMTMEDRAISMKIKMRKQNQTSEISRRVRASWTAFGRLRYRCILDCQDAKSKKLAFYRLQYMKL